MRHDRKTYLRLTSVAAVLGAILLVAPLTLAASPSDNSSADQSSAAQTALAIAGAAAMTGAASSAPSSPTAAPVQAAGSKRPMTAEERQKLMMLLILHETSRNPIGALR